MRNILFIISAILCLVGCSKEESFNDDSLQKDFVTLSADTLLVGPEGGNLNVTVESSEDWRLIDNHAEWVSPSSTGGKSGETITFAVQPNTTGQALENVYKIFSGSAVKKMVVISDAEYTIEMVSEDNFEVGSDGETINVFVKTNILDLDCKYSEGGEEWINYKGSETSFGSTILTFDIKKNETYLNRESEVTLFGKNKEMTFTIAQKQLDAVLTEDELFQEFDMAARTISINVKTNIEYTLGELPEWIELLEVKKGEVVDGLEQQTLVFNLAESVGSRVAELLFNYENVNFLKITIKQKNPNPEMITVPDANFRKVLAKNGFVVLGEEDDSECEILETGKTATSLDASSSNIQSIEGIEHFTNLESIKLTNNSIEILDISKLTKVNNLEMESMSNLKSVLLGSNPIQRLTLVKAIYSDSVTISGDKLEEIYAWIKFWESNYDKMSELDITGCTALKKCNTRDRTALKNLYVTSYQKENVELSTSYKTTVVVRD